MTTPPVCDYEGSDYQTSFWDKGGREYEDRTEAIALKRLLPKHGRLLLELGAGAGRNTPRYAGFERVVLLDYSRTQLEQAQQRLGTGENRQGRKSADEQIGKSANEQMGQGERYIFVAADVYRLPFVDGLFDAATMIRTLHHMSDAPKALGQVSAVISPAGIFILEFANKLNLKAILRYVIGRQKWNPFTLEPVEFAELNFDFHPKAVRDWLERCGFRVERTLALSHFRVGFLKRVLPTGLLVLLDSLLQWTGALVQLTPSIFMRARRLHPPGSQAIAYTPPTTVLAFFKCPECGHSPLTDGADQLVCPNCESVWKYENGIFDFRRPVSST